MEEIVYQVDLSRIETALAGISSQLSDVLGSINHPAMTTPFEYYSVTEAALVLLMVLETIKLCIRMIKGGFSWLT